MRKQKLLYQSYAIEMVQPYKSLILLPAAFTPSSS